MSERQHKFKWANTARHDEFKFLINRDLDDKHVQKLMESVKKYGFLQPIVVTESGGIIEGQHRVRVAKLLDRPVPYDILEGVSDEEATEIIIEMNNERKGWDILNHVEAKAKAGDEDYISLKEVIDNTSEMEINYREKVIKKKLSPATIVLAFHEGKTITGMKQIIERGEFKFDENMGYKILDRAKDVMEALGPDHYSLSKTIRASKASFFRWKDSKVLKSVPFSATLLGKHKVKCREKLDVHDRIVDDWVNIHASQ